MRLIDADEIIKETWGVVIKDVFHMDETVDVISRKDIEKAPTVKAIPIEWIKEWVERDENYWDYQYLTDVLLKDWEKENARD